MTSVRLRRWSEPDAPLLVGANTADMTAHIAGPETDEQVARRHRNYLRFWEEDTAHMFAVLDGDEPVGGIGWWHIDRDGVAAAETGWFVLPHAQGRGVARAAVLLTIEDAAASLAAGTDLYAFPSVTNRPSNALCAGTGFELRGEEDFPFRGEVLHVNVWATTLGER
ncbi:GNAT family N-acetyltransferase [Leifsonia sp. WHRI 6310E]|uniref:GNAT family N-acetyltransferase n=1 Tax=Leifsonia sp. WHRI 6310E TaxID=3162562 RepID=UPI0032EFFD91